MAVGVCMGVGMLCFVLLKTAGFVLVPSQILLIFWWYPSIRPCASMLKVRKQRSDGFPCLDKAVPTRGSLIERSGKQRSDGLSCLDKAVLAQGEMGGG